MNATSRIPSTVAPPYHFSLVLTTATGNQTRCLNLRNFAECARHFFLMEKRADL